MRLRTYLGVLLAFLVVVAASYLTHENRELLHARVQLWPGRSVPLYGALLGVFLAGFLPSATVLFVQTLKRDLAARRERQRSRELTSLEGSLRRALDLGADTQWLRAAAELETLLVETPEDFVALLRHGEALRHLGRAAEALEVHRRASQLYPQSVAVLYALADDYEVLGEDAVAREVRGRVLRDFAGVGVPVLRRERDEHIARGELDEAARSQDRLDALLEGTPAAARPSRDQRSAEGLRYANALGLLEAEKIDLARAALRELLAESPEFIPARLLLGEAELVADDPEAAVAVWRGGFSVTGNPVFLQRLQDHFIESEQPQLAIEVSHQLVAAAGADDLVPRLFLGRLYARLEMLDEAMRVLEGIDDRIAGSPHFHYLRGRIHERRGEMRRAADAYLAALGELGITREYRCRACGLRYAEWQDRCEGCGAWGTLGFPLEEAGDLDELRRRQAAAWGGFEEPADDWLPEPPRREERARGAAEATLPPLEATPERPPVEAPPAPPEDRSAEEPPAR